MRIGFVSTRFAGTDGVSLESLKWAEVLEEMGHEIHWFSGRSDRDPTLSMCVPEAFFGHPENEWISARIWGGTEHTAEVANRIDKLAGYLQSMLGRFVERFEIEVLVAENALTIPVHVPLGVALTQFLRETELPAVAHHHDFYWERDRFAVNTVSDLLELAFPPKLDRLVHTVINQAAQEELARRKGLSSILVPNVFNFESEPVQGDSYAADLREEIGLEPDDYFFLQPTRIVPRKGIEHAVKLISRLDDPRCKLVISHDAGDEGYEYQHTLEALAEEEGVELRVIADRVSECRQRDEQGRKLYTLWDIYGEADFVTYPSLYEGFGNALLEAIYFRKPVMINRYSIYVEDIAPKGFRLVEIDGEITPSTVEGVRALLRDPALRMEMADHNYRLAREHYGFDSLKRALTAAFAEIAGS